MGANQRLASLSGIASALLLTISDSLARAGKSVGGASLWRSMASNTSIKPRMLDAGAYLSNLESSKVNCAKFSHLGMDVFEPTACATFLTVVSKRCLPVTHSKELAIAY